MGCEFLWDKVAKIRLKCLLIVFQFCLLTLFPRFGLANSCFEAAAIAARESGVPENVLIAIAKTETGRTRNGQFTPWPWTINAGGKGQWFDTKAELLDAALKHLATGKTLFDLGCFQINYRWHQENFVSLDAMIDPVENARYAAKFLRSLHGEFGDWTLAAGAYHSRTQSLAEAYRAKFEQHLLSSDTHPVKVAHTANPALPRENFYPLLQVSRARATMGSLVPIRDE